MTHFLNFDTHNHISGTTEATVAKFCIQIEISSTWAFDDRLLSNGPDQGHVICFFLILPQSCL